MKYFWLIICISLTCSVEALNLQNGKPFVIVIDPGHGGKDPGTIGTSLKAKEKDINLAVALMLGELIESNHPNTNIVYTRQKDVFITLNERAEKANKSKADLFISIHANATESNPTANGTEIYTLGLSRSNENLEVARRENAVILLEDNYQQTYEGYDPNSDESFIIFQFMQNQFLDQSISFAADIQSQFIVNAKRNDRGVRQAGFLVIRKTSMPSVLIELGFLSNKREEAYLNSKEGQRALARCIYNAFDKYKKEYDRKTNINSTATTNPAVTPPTPSAPAPEVKPEIKPDAKPALKPETKPEVKPETKPTLKPETKPEVKPKTTPEKKTEASAAVATKKTTPATVSGSGIIVYKIQILATEDKLPKNSPRLKGHREQYYVENGLYKYTVGETTNLEEAQSIKKAVSKEFAGAFIVKFKNGKRLK